MSSSDAPPFHDDRVRAVLRRFGLDKSTVATTTEVAAALYAPPTVAEVRRVTASDVPELRALVSGKVGPPGRRRGPGGNRR